MKLFLVLLIQCLLSACSTMEMPTVFGNKVKENPRFGRDAVVYNCASYQSFALKMAENGQEAWLMYPDHEVNLTRSSTDKNLYHYGVIDLRLNGDQTTLDDGELVHYKECKPQTAKK